MTTNPLQGVKIFYAYADQDDSLLRELENHLRPLQRQRLIVGWHKRKIRAGAEWAQEVDAHLSTAHIILLLVSADFVASDYCYNVEMTKALERHEAREACVIPIILRPTEWEGEPYGKLQALPTNGIPVIEWSNRDRAFVSIVKSIKEAIEELNIQLPENSSVSLNSPPAASIDRTLALLNDYVDILISQGRWSEVLNRIEEALQLVPDNISWLTRQVQAFHQLGQNAQAQKVYEQLRTLYPDDENVHALAKTVFALSDSLQVAVDQLGEDVHANSQQKDMGDEQKQRTRVQRNTPTRFKLQAADKTDVGKQREQNEDAIYKRIESREDGDTGLFMVADGMGGYKAGEIASRLAVETISKALDKFFKSIADQPTIKLLPSSDKSVEDQPTLKILPPGIETVKVTSQEGDEELKLPDRSIMELFRDEFTFAIQEANRAIMRYSEKATNTRGMGSTVTMTLLQNYQAYIANVGDSRTYLLRNGELKALTRDHSLVARLVEAKQIEPEDVYSHPQRNLIYRSLGAGRQIVDVDVFYVSLLPGDRLLLCSDGLWEMIRDQELLRVLAEMATPHTICDRLIELANANGGEDNISAVVIFVE